MNINDFLKFNNFCPVCQEPLTLYAQIIDGSLYRADYIDENKNIKFNIFKLRSKSHNSLILNYSNNISQIKNWTSLEGKTIFLYYLCNNDSFKELSCGDHEINMEKACYYRDSVIMTISSGGLLINNCNIDFPTKVEGFSFKETNVDQIKTYILRLDHLSKSTVLWHYIVPPNKKIGYKPNVFEKKLPYLSNRPSFNLIDREKLLKRFDSWILMS